MKFIQSINPKQIFSSSKTKSKKSRSVAKSRSVSKSEPSSFYASVSSTSSSSSSVSTHKNNKNKSVHHQTTQRSVLQKSNSHDLTHLISGDWSDTSNSSGSQTNTNENQIYSDLVQAFKLIDRDGDGKITREELKSILTQVVPADDEPPTEEEITAMMKEIDIDNDGCITFSEFEAIRSAFGPASDLDELKAAFEVFDADRDGKITAEELLKVFLGIGGDMQCTLDECKKMIRSVDKNGDGSVCFEDFRRMMEMQRR